MLSTGLTAPTVTLTATGAITQPGGIITATTLTGSAASADVRRRRQPEHQPGAFTSTGALSVTDGTGLTVTGAVSGGPVTLTSAGDLAITAASPARRSRWPWPATSPRAAAAP